MPEREKSGGANLSELKTEIKTANLEELNEVIDDISDDDIGGGDAFETKNVYSSIPNTEYLWLQAIANRFDTSKSFIIKRIIYNARVREEFDETELI